MTHRSVTGNGPDITGRDPQKPNRLFILLWIGAASLTIGLLSAGIGLIMAGTR